MIGIATSTSEIKKVWIKRRLKSIYPIKYILDKKEKVLNGLQILAWIKGGKEPPPPPVIQREKIIEESRKNNAKILVETGTYLGSTIEYVSEKFKKIYSIEVDEKLYNMNKNTLGSRKNIKIIKGDSKDKIKEVINIIDEKALFWLDAHCSEGITGMGSKYTPVLDEIRKIENEKENNHVILIDDLRLFVGDDRYPSVEEVRETTKRGIVKDKKRDMIIIK